MSGKASDYKLFWREFRQTFETTGAVLPSGRALCCELARHVSGNGRPRRILEVGPGTGVATEQIIARMGPQDTLELVELNDRFVATLQQRLETEPAWRQAAQRVRIHHLPVQQLAADAPYDAIVSGLPLNNFPATLVAEIFAKLREVAAAGATLSFFEYVGVRKLKSLVARRDERRRLGLVESLIGDARKQWGFGRRCVMANVPPAWVHHLRYD
ncbi:MAG: methyltransferase domain-containing protein [Planctomycetales bacterium]|nr:methyltransferase domain-containing protein [Planctomycetales bacterium]